MKLTYICNECGFDLGEHEVLCHKCIYCEGYVTRVYSHE